MAEAEINGTTIWYDTEGPADAPVLLTIHGGLGFDHVHLKDFGRLAGRRRVVFYDQRGNGRSGQPPRETVTIEQLADDAAGLLDHLGVERAVALGHSYGGFVAQELALRHPDRVAGLVLVTTTPGQLGRDERADETEQGPPLPDELLALMSTPPANDEEFAAGMPRLAPFYVRPVDDGRVDAMLALLPGTIFRADVMMRGFEVLAGWSSVDRLHSITAPTLVLAGRHDLHTSFPQSKRISSRIPGAQLVIFEDSAHFPWIEEPDAFFTTLEAWLAATGP